jgi:hypothetical protein
VGFIDPEMVKQADEACLDPTNICGRHVPSIGPVQRHYNPLVAITRLSMAFPRLATTTSWVSGFVTTAVAANQQQILSLM